jgi:deazaflavin-dependent oxidoreductase (nitroreductase family)
MAYLKPNSFTRKVFNPIAERFGLGGSEKLMVRGRKSGEMRHVPVIPVEHEGARYIVSTRGESEWVRNIRAAGGGELHSKRGGVSTFGVTEVPVEQRAPVIGVYRAAIGKEAEKYWSKLPDDKDHPVFRIEAG